MAQQIFQYDVAISFAGENRDVAQKIADRLKNEGVQIFYDEYYKAELWGKDLYEHFADVYSKKARYCIMMLSEHYLRKNWTTHERKSAQARAFQERREYILPVKLDDTEIPGIPNTIGYLDLRDCTVEDIVRSVIEKLGQTPKAPGANPTATATFCSGLKVAEVIAEARRMVGDTMAPYRVSDTIMMNWLESGQLDALSERPDLRLAEDGRSLIDDPMVTGLDNELAIGRRYLRALAHYVAHCFCDTPEDLVKKQSKYHYQQYLRSLGVTK